MKRVFVVLVVFVGYNSGLIAPSFASKFSGETTPSLNSDDSQSTQPQSIEIDLENSNNIDEKELFQTGTSKENVLNERAFIYIKKQYRPLHSSQVYSSRRYSINKPFIINERPPQINGNPINKIRATPLKQLFIPNVKGKTRYNPPTFKLNDDRYLLQKEANKAIVTSKPAIYRILHNLPDETIDQETKAYSSKAIENHHEKPPDMTSYPRYRVNYNFGIPAYMWPSADIINDITLKQENMSAEGSLAHHNIGNLSPLDLKDEDVLLDRYIKEALNTIESKEVLTKNEEMCQNCKNGKADGHSNCKCHKIDTTKLKDTTHNQRSDKNKHKCNKELNSALESRENKKMFYENNLTNDDNLQSDKLH